MSVFLTERGAIGSPYGAVSRLEAYKVTLTYEINGETVREPAWLAKRAESGTPIPVQTLLQALMIEASRNRHPSMLPDTFEFKISVEAK